MIEFLVPERGTQVADMTGQGEQLRTLEIRTDAGIVRVNTNLVSTRTRALAVVVEIEPNTSYQPLTPAGGDWTAESMRTHSGRINVTLTKEG